MTFFPGDESHAPAPNSRADLVSTLRQMLPEGKITEPSRLGAESSPYDAEIVYDDGKGPAAIGLSFYRYVPNDMQGEMTIGCPTTAQSEDDNCVTTSLPDHSRVTLLKTYAFQDDRRLDTKVWSAQLLTSSGQYVSVSEWNSSAPSGAPISRAEPPLSGTQLKELVTAGVWRRIVDAVVDERRGWAQTPTPSEGEGPTVEAVNDTLAALLPKDRQVFETRSDYPYVDVFDAKAKNIIPIETTVLLDVQQHTASEVADELYGADAETLPDGTKVATRRGPGDKGVEESVMWTVDTMRTDGLRVVISAYNPGSRGVPARPTPNLTMEQLREIALSPKWDRFR
ncbi:hypothetical protein [Streptomyces sp. NBC_01092]|uniref:hypothetical protein n=1 Tax=Streptomyces sp. NBC_01092 TaxID=2903748 RepID=UPI00386E5B06|nr:hypothetical protein OG254_31050 [Streptomyces sp. NBC_01092]